MWFNVLKGAYPSLQQIDKTLDVGDTDTALVRGTVMKIDAVGSVQTFVACQDEDAADVTAYPYFCLVAQDDFVAGMAGTVGQGQGSGTFTDPSSVGGTMVSGRARVTGLAVGMPMEFETDQYGADISGYTVGELLTVGDGGLLVQATGTVNVCAQVTIPVTSRWVNSAWAVTGRRTGANVSVLTARTLWLPGFTVA